ncbi:hypothetical protein JRO89_XS12G0020800 [Xanthoceras sorbifolium]|uniref:Uncharacterized protein n=1 Tax=Xanthoceras sorbifolium TaxID=99658 RepID=A0ABQ8HAK2_9ROSI|nr:hypothetical protein JRO89_XS12G0020800 [Xanthoceras sorbifolium]
MAVPGRRNGLMDEDENEPDNALFEEDGVDIDLEDTPQHLRELAAAAQLGDVQALRLALEYFYRDGVFCLDLCLLKPLNLNYNDFIWLFMSPLVGFLTHFFPNEYTDNLNGSIDEPVEDGDTALHLTCLYGYLSCVQLLLERGANLEAKDEDGAVPLHDACAGGFTEIVQLLINSASAECVKRMLETVDAEGDAPIHHAARGEHVDVIRVLLGSGASPVFPNSYGQTPSELADPGSEARRILEAAASAEACQ